MGALTLIYVVCHLAAYLVVGLALGRASVIPLWAAWSLALTSPITLVAFPTRLHELRYLVIALWFVGSIPAALAVWRSRFEDAYCEGLARAFGIVERRHLPSWNSRGEWRP